MRRVQPFDSGNRGRQPGLRPGAVALAPRREGCIAAALTAALMAACLLLAGTAARAQTHFGTWLTDDYKAKVELRECGDGKLCSEIVWLKDPLDENGKPWRDGLNPDPSKRRRTVVGIDILKNLKKTAEKTWTGEIYDPEEGKYYYLKRIKIGPEKVEIRGCLSSGWPCRSKYWTRTKPVREPEPLQIAKQPRAAEKKPMQQAAVVPPVPAPRPATLASAAQAQTPPAPKRAVQQQVAAVPPPVPKPAAPVSKPAPVQQQARTQKQTRAQQPDPAQYTLPWQNQVAARAAGPATTAFVARQATTAAGDGSGYLVQVTAGQNQNDALRTFGKLQRRYPQLLGSYLPNIQRVDLGAKGIWYRVRVGPMEQHTAAADFCQRLKEAGGDCLIRRE
jgi:uncharacterized protein (DUF2147 family)